MRYNELQTGNAVHAPKRALIELSIAFTYYPQLDSCFFFLVGVNYPVIMKEYTPFTFEWFELVDAKFRYLKHRQILSKGHQRVSLHEKR